MSSPALQSSISMLSFAPATITFGANASTARAGSFCLFCENGAGSLAVLTSESLASVTAPPELARTSTVRSAAASGRAKTFLMFTISLIGCSGGSR